MAKVFALIDCSIPINTRNQKIINSINSHVKDAEIHIITWNREGDNYSDSKYYHTFNQIAPYANIYSKLKGLPDFRKFIGLVLEKINPNVIIASHWSNLVLVSGFKRKEQVLVYENLDLPTGRGFIRFLSRALERYSLKKVNLIVHASRFFKDFYPIGIPQIILENKPAYKPCVKDMTISSPLKIAFIGSIRYKNILMNLVDAVKNDKRYELYFHGGGEDLNEMLNYCRNVSNVFFTGKYEYSNVVSFYHQSDIIWAAYPNKDYNVVYAISNKFHESLYVGVPCVFSNKTKLADFVKEENIGFVVDPYSVVSIKDLLRQVSDNVIDLNAVKQSMIDYQKKELGWDDDFKLILPYLQ